MTEHGTLDRRLAFHRLDTATITTLRQEKEVILSLLSPVLDSFYLHVKDFPETRRFFKDDRHIDRARGAQLRHWGIIADARFDAEYEASVRTIGEVHNRIGLEPSWYIGGYNFLITTLNRRIAEHFSGKGVRQVFSRGKAGRASALQSAVTRAALLDMDIAISVYLEAGRRERSEMLERLAADFETRIGGIVGAVASASEQMQGAAQTLSAAAEEASTQSTSVSAAAEEATTNVQTVATAAEQLAASVREIAEQVGKSNQISSAAVNEARDMNGKVQSLSSAAQTVGEVVKLINDIAEQTNLLALNATIEAARAGEAGKGFAVVASEVKQLATQTSRATSDISEQISAIQNVTGEAVDAIERISETIANMNSISATIASAVEEQDAATQEIARNVQQAASGTQDVTNNIYGISQATEETGQTSNKVLDSANYLSEQAEGLKREVAHFLETIRAA